jgi:hypothetical protein
MSIQAMLLPLFVQVALTFGLLFWMGWSRVGSVKSTETRIADVALGQPNWPTKVQQISNCYSNQFQLPVLYYGLVALALLTRSANLLFVVLSWVFVLTRLLHAYIHIGSNVVRYRFNVFALGVMILLAMWLIYAFRILSGLS